MLQSQRDKRSTWIGTPHWMPPELFPNKPGDEVHPYGNEVCCTIAKFYISLIVAVLLMGGL